MKKKILIGINIVLGAFILFSCIFYVRSNRTMKRARQEAVEIAREFASLEEVDRFYWFTREKTYFTVMGSDDKDKKIVVIIPRSGEKVTVLNQKDGLTEGEAIEKINKVYNPHRIVKANLGMFKDKPTWEIVAENENDTFDYYLLDFTTGKPANLLKNI